MTEETRLTQLVQWLDNKYARHGELEDKEAADALRYAISLVGGLDEWLGKRCKPEAIDGVWLDAVDDAFMEAWKDADVWLKREAHD